MTCVQGPHRTLRSVNSWGEERTELERMVTPDPPCLPAAEIQERGRAPKAQNKNGKAASPGGVSLPGASGRGKPKSSKSERRQQPLQKKTPVETAAPSAPAPSILMQVLGRGHFQKVGDSLSLRAGEPLELRCRGKVVHWRVPEYLEEEGEGRLRYGEEELLPQPEWVQGGSEEAGQRFISTYTVFIGIKMDPHWASHSVQLRAPKGNSKMGAQDPSEAEWFHRMDTWLPTILGSQFWGQQIVPIGRKVAEAKQKRPAVQLAATLLSGAPPPEARERQSWPHQHCPLQSRREPGGGWDLGSEGLPTVSQFSFLT